MIDFYSEDRKKNHHEETLSLFKNKNKTLKNKGKKNITPSKRFLKHKQKRKEKSKKKKLKANIFNNSLGKKLKSRKKDTSPAKDKKNGNIRNKPKDKEKNNIKKKQKKDIIKLKSNLISNSSRVSCQEMNQDDVHKTLLSRNESKNIKIPICEKLS